MLVALLQGLLGASSLVLGALLGIFWQPSKTVSAAIMAFGSGTLLSAISFEITTPTYLEGGFLPLPIGFIAGGTLFTLATRSIDRQGGFLRNPASRRRYLFQYRQKAESEIIDRLSHVEVMRNLPPAEAHAIIPLLKPIHAEAEQILCQEGTPGDSFYMIIEGEAQVLKGQKVMTILKPGEVFGEMALLTGEPRSATVAALTTMELYQLPQKHFDNVLTRSPHLAGAISRSLARRLRSTTQSQFQAERDLEHWRQQALDSMELDLPPAEEQAIVHKIVKSSAPMAILLGTLIDNVPESLTIGMGSQESHFGGSFLLSVFIANFPEALSSSIGMKQSGTQTRRILSLWLGVVALGGLFAVVGNLLGNTTSDLFVTLTHALAGGAMLAMLASTMMPEAYELGGGSVAFSTILGFLAGFFVSSAHL